MALPTDDTPSGVTIRTDIPVSHHPDTIRGDGPGATLAKGAMKTIYEAHGKINTVAAQVQDKPRLATAVTPVAESAIRGAGRTITLLTAQIEHLDKAIADTLKRPVEAGLAGQIRQHWANQSNRLSGLQSAIKDGDAATISAVLHAPHYLSGLTADQQGIIRTLAAARFAPKEVATRAETEAAMHRLTAVTDEFMGKITECINSWKDADQRILEEGLR